MFKEELFSPGTLVITCNVVYDIEVSPGNVNSSTITISDDIC